MTQVYSLQHTKPSDIPITLRSIPKQNRLSPLSTSWADYRQSTSHCKAKKASAKTEKEHINKTELNKGAHLAKNYFFSSDCSV
jgi:hypothetical protein